MTTAMLSPPTSGNGSAQAAPSQRFPGQDTTASGATGTVEFPGTRVRSASSTSRGLVAGLAPDEVDLRLHGARRDTDIGHRTLAFYLHDMEQRRLYSLFGCPSTSQYARKRLGLGKTLAYDLIGAGRALAELELLDRELFEERLTWCQVKALLQVVVPETQKAWIEKTRGKSLRWIQERVRASERGRPPREDGKGTPTTRFVIRARVSAEAYEAWETARRKLQDELAEAVTDAALLRHLAEDYLCEKNEATDSSDPSPYRVIVRHCPSCRASRLQTDDGDVPIDESTTTRLACEGEVVHVEPEPIEREPGEKESGTPDKSRGGESSTRPVASRPAIDRPTPPALRRKILARDGYRCRHCQRSGRLHVHHVEYRSQGGSSVEGNLAALCDRCHGLVHDDLLFITGEPEGELVFRNARGEVVDAAGPRPGGGALLDSLRSRRGETFFGEGQRARKEEPDVARTDASTPEVSARAESRSENGPVDSTAAPVRPL